MAESISSGSSQRINNDRETLKSMTDNQDRIFDALHAKVCELYRAQEFDACYRLARSLLDQPRLSEAYAAKMHLILATSTKDYLYHATEAVDMFTKLYDDLPEPPSPEEESIRINNLNEARILLDMANNDQEPMEVYDEDVVATRMAMIEKTLQELDDQEGEPEDTASKTSDDESQRRHVVPARGGQFECCGRGRQQFQPHRLLRQSTTTPRTQWRTREIIETESWRENGWKMAGRWLEVPQGNLQAEIVEKRRK